MFAGDFGDFLDLALAEQARRPDVAQLERAARDHVDSDRFGKSFRLVQPRFGRAQSAAAVTALGQHQQGPLAAGKAAVVFAVEDAQSPSSASGSLSRLRLCAGCSVETACL